MVSYSSRSVIASQVATRLDRSETGAASTSIRALQRCPMAPSPQQAPLTALPVCVAEFSPVCDQVNSNTISSGSYPEAGS